MATQCFSWRTLTLAFVLAMGACCSSLPASIYYWTGYDSASWNDLGDWFTNQSYNAVPTVLPGLNDDVLLRFRPLQ